MQTTKHLTRLSLALSTLIISVPAHAQYSGSHVATAAAAAKPASVRRGGKGVLIVTVSVGPRYHVNAHKPNDRAYIPTAFQGQPTPGITFGSPHYPAPKAMKLSYADKPLLVYTGKVAIAVPFIVSKTVKPGSIALTGTVSFQGCDAKSCYPPASAPVRAVVTVK